MSCGRGPLSRDWSVLSAFNHCREFDTHLFESLPEKCLVHDRATSAVYSMGWYMGDRLATAQIGVGIQETLEMFNWKATTEPFCHGDDEPLRVLLTFTERKKGRKFTEEEIDRAFAPDRPWWKIW